MSKGIDLRRRRCMAMLAAAPMLLLRGARAEQSRFTLTLTGQALITHDLCGTPYAGLVDVMREVRRGDVAITDLEAPIRTGASGAAPQRAGVFLHEAGLAELRCLHTFGFDVLTLANNHAGDFGRAGVLATRDAVRAAGFHSAGSGGNLEEASAATRFTLAGESLAVIAIAAGKIRQGAAATACLPGINELRLDSSGQPQAEDMQRTLASIRCAAGAARTVVCLHNHEWGEDMRLTRAWVRRFAHACVDAGAGVFFAHGAPLLQGIELYRGAPIFYCLGSLIFHSRTPPGYYPPEVWESVIAHLHYRGGLLCQIELVPVVLNEYGDDPSRQDETRGRPRLAHGANAARILNRLRQLGTPFATELLIARGRGRVAVE